MGGGVGAVEFDSPSKRIDGFDLSIQGDEITAQF